MVERFQPVLRPNVKALLLRVDERVGLPSKRLTRLTHALFESPQCTVVTLTVWSVPLMIGSARGSQGGDASGVVGVRDPKKFVLRRYRSREKGGIEGTTSVWAFMLAGVADPSDGGPPWWALGREVLRRQREAEERQEKSENVAEICEERMADERSKKKMEQRSTSEHLQLSPRFCGFYLGDVY